MIHSCDRRRATPCPGYASLHLELQSGSRDGERIQKSRRRSRRSWRKKLTQVEVKINSSGKIRQEKEVAANTLGSKARYWPSAPTRHGHFHSSGRASP
ncbi:hypothetical protein O3P69_013137 [Scylla paramamosain]|uniref:Uncharacterized protein n=1 Tax=Scylla paramamosain TaxID=85552 RepID=A0AAW0TYQ2_SCYPA